MIKGCGSWCLCGRSKAGGRPGLGAAPPCAPHGSPRAPSHPRRLARHSPAVLQEPVANLSRLMLVFCMKACNHSLSLMSTGAVRGSCPMTSLHAFTCICCSFWRCRAEITSGRGFTATVVPSCRFRGRANAAGTSSTPGIPPAAPAQATYHGPPLGALRKPVSKADSIPDGWCNCVGSSTEKHYRKCCRH